MAGSMQVQHSQVQNCSHCRSLSMHIQNFKGYHEIFVLQCLCGMYVTKYWNHKQMRSIQEFGYIAHIEVLDATSC